MAQLVGALRPAHRATVPEGRQGPPDVGAVSNLACPNRPSPPRPALGRVQPWGLATAVLGFDRKHARYSQAEPRAGCSTVVQLVFGAGFSSTELRPPPSSSWGRRPDLPSSACPRSPEMGPSTACWPFLTLPALSLFWRRTDLALGYVHDAAARVPAVTSPG